MRNLFEVINQILSLIPSDKTDFIQSLISAKESVAFAPPELMRYWWRTCAEILEENMTASIDHEWEKEIIKIWQD